MLPHLVNLVFIFDGGETPNPLPEDAVRSMTDLINLFGFHVHQVSTSADLLMK